MDHVKQCKTKYVVQSTSMLRLIQSFLVQSTSMPDFELWLEIILVGNFFEKSLKTFFAFNFKEEHNFLRYKKVSKFHFQTKKNICELTMLIIASSKKDGVHYYIPTVVWIWCLLVLLTICLKIFQNFFSELRILMIYHMEYPGDPVPGSAFSFLFRFALKD